MDNSTYRIKIKDGYFTDQVRQSPVDKYQLRSRRRALLFIVALAAIWVTWHLWPLAQQ